MPVPEARNSRSKEKPSSACWHRISGHSFRYARTGVARLPSPALPLAFVQRPLHGFPHTGFQAGDDLRAEAFAEALIEAGAALAVVVRRGQDGAGDSFGAAQIAQHPAQVGTGVAVGDQVIPALPLHVRQIFQPDTDFIAAEGIGQQILPLDVQAVALFILPEELNGRGGEFHRGHFLSEMDSWSP